MAKSSGSASAPVSSPEGPFTATLRSPGRPPRGGAGADDGAAPVGSLGGVMVPGVGVDAICSVPSVAVTVSGS